MLSRTRRFGALALGAAALASAAIAATPAATWAAVNTTTTVYNAEAAGFQAGLASADSVCGSCWHFRYVQARVVLPDVTGTVDHAAFGGVGFAVHLSNATESAVLGISTSTGGGPYNAAFVLESRPSGSPVGACTNHSSPAVPAGDTVQLSVYFDGSHIGWNAADLTDSTKSFSGSCTDPTISDSFTQAQVETEFGFTPWDTAHVPGLVHGNVKLNSFTNTVVTNRTGIRGSIGSASWPVQNVVLTDTGTSNGQVRASAPFAWGSYATPPDNHVRNGRNFGVWLPSKPA